MHATLRAAAPLGIHVVALHVHHGLNDGADAWLLHCEATCRRWTRAGRSLAFEARRLEGRPAPGGSVEAWARRARYGALSEMAQQHGIGLVLLGHHRRDQAETFLLQALRGAGVDGLSAMPGLIVREGISWARPWLESPREAIDAYVRTHR
ncbi:MAG: tRNA lysidine(34) synthetase, partial [Caldimonas sp.]